MVISIVIENRVILQDHVINLPRAERPEGSRKLSLLFTQTFFAQTYGTVHGISLETKFPETMRVFEELCGNINNLQSAT